MNVLFKVEELVKYSGKLEVIYMTNDGFTSQRHIKILKVNGEIIQAYCYLRGANRTFKIENILAFVPVNVKKGVAV